MSDKDDLDGELTATALRTITEKDDLDSVLTIGLAIDTEVTSLSELGILLPNLVELKLTAPSYLPSLRKFGTCMNLKILWASAVGLDSLDGASGVPNLVELYISYNQITDLSPLTFLPSLEVLDLESNHVESGLELRFLSLCPKLNNVTMVGCPLADLPDYRQIVKRRLPEDCILDSGEEDPFPASDKLMNLEDANFIKELVADGLLDEDELLADEPLSRPFTAIGIRPKSGRYAPISPGSTRPRTAVNIFKNTHTSFVKKDESTSDLTTGGVIHGHRGLLSRARRNRPKSAGSISPGPQKTPDEIKSDIQEQLKSWKSEQERTPNEVNILTIDHETFDTIPEEKPARSSLVRSIRSSTSGEPVNVHDDPTTSKTLTAPADALSSSLRDVLKFKDIKKTAEQELNSRSFRSRQAQLLAEGQILKKVASSSTTQIPGGTSRPTTITAPIIKHQNTNRNKQSGINI